MNKLKVGVCGWNLSHNAIGRAYTLAMLYETFANVEIIGTIFPSYGVNVWEPIRNTQIPKHYFVVRNESYFIDNAFRLVSEHPYDIIHISKPRITNIIFGILYKIIWNSKVVLDIDDEELAFVNEETPINLDLYLRQYKILPKFENLPDSIWTRIGVGLVNIFDAITVSNPELQSKYGGEIIRHVRNEKLYSPSIELQKINREKYNIPINSKVILFFGTPRKHKGLINVANAISTINRKDVYFVIVGDFPDNSLKIELCQVQNCNLIFLGNQSVESIPDIVSLGDCCVFASDSNELVTKFQIPAKLSDALGMGLPVLVTNTKPFKEFIELNVVVPIDSNNMYKEIENVLFNENKQKELGLNAFLSLLSYSANKPILQKLVSKLID